MQILEDKQCNHWSVRKYKGGLTSEELGRYGPELMQLLVDKIANPTKRTLESPIKTTRHKILRTNEWSDRKSQLCDLEPITLDKVQMVRMGFKMRPLRDGAGKPSPGLIAPPDRKPSPICHDGEAIINYCDKWKDYAKMDKQGKVHPFPDWFISDIRKILAQNTTIDQSVSPGQPFRLGIIKDLLRRANDPDYGYMDDLAKGLVMGVEEFIPLSPGIWPSVDEMRSDDYEDEKYDKEQASLEAKENYASAIEHLKTIEETYVEERALDMVLGPYTKAEAATACGCNEKDLITGAMGANIEKDKIRPIFDASTTNVNPEIQRHTLERTTAPGLADGVHGVKWSHRNVGWQYKSLGILKKYLVENGASTPQGGRTSDVKWSHRKHSTTTSKTPCHAMILTVLKSDVSKAHRRCKIQKKDWRYQVAKLGDNYWINKVGTYGVASAQTHWGRVAAALVRLLYYLFPAVDWIMIFVDDIIAIMNKLFETPLSTAIMATLYAIGCPMAWHKTSMSHHSLWVGFEMQLERPRFQVAKEKLLKITSELGQWIEGKHIKALDIHKAVSRIQWATSACPTAKPFLQPIWAWMTAVSTTGGVPSKSLQQIAILILRMLSKPWEPDINDHQDSEWEGASDASRRDDRSGIGGWVYNGKNPNMEDVWWFMEDFKVDGRDSWLFHNGEPRERVASMELFGTLALLEALGGKMSSPSIFRIRLKMATDNQGNSMSILNSRTKTWPSSIILMQLVWSAHNKNIELGVHHIFRELNSWADQLAGGDSTGFNPNKRLHPTMNAKGWDLLSMFTTEEALKSVVAKIKRAKKKSKNKG